MRDRGIEGRFGGVEGWALGELGESAHELGRGRVVVGSAGNVTWEGDWSRLMAVYPKFLWLLRRFGNKVLSRAVPCMCGFRPEVVGRLDT